MRILRSNHTKRLVFAFLLFSLLHATIGGILTVGLQFIVTAQPYTKLYVDPPVASRNPGGLAFIVNVIVENVTDLYTFAFRLQWQLGLLEVVSVDEDTSFFDGAFASTSGSNYVDVGSTLIGQVPGETGNGTLVSFTLRATDTGNCTLALVDTELFDTTVPGDIPHTVEHGYFYTTYPVARFTFSPDPSKGSDYYGRPIPDEVVTFNATISYDPDQTYKGQPANQTYWGIYDYFWDFGDYTYNYTTTPIVTHTYSENGTYLVKLTVTDDDWDTDEVTYPSEGLRVQLHDVSILNATIVNDPPLVQAGGNAYINVTVLNQGSEPEYMNVTAYAQLYPEVTWQQINKTQFHFLWWNEFHQTWEVRYSLPSGDNETATIKWDTTGFSEGNYTIRVNITIVKQVNLIWTSYAHLEPDKSDNTLTNGNVTIVTYEIHNVAVYSAGMSPTNLELDEWLYARASIRNRGTGDENVNATITVLYPNSTVVKTWTFTNLSLGVGKTIALGDIKSLYLIEGSGIFQEGFYNITVTVLIVNPATLEEVLDEDPTDNTLSKLVKIQMIPVASFTYSPENPLVGETVSFNASRSYAPGENGGTIKKYMWTFADGWSYNETSPTITHVYDRAGSFPVTLKVTDDAGLTGQFILSPPLKIQAFHNIAVTNVTFSTEEATVGDLVSINVTVENIGYFEETFNITAFYDESEIDAELDATLPIGDKTTFMFLWDTQNVAFGDYVIEAVASNVTGEIDTSDNIRIGGILTIEGMPSFITLVATPTSIELGKNTTFSGSLDPKIAGENVTIWFKSIEGNWSILSRETTTTDGAYSYPWTPDTAGSYMIFSSWAGDDFTQPCESETTVVTVREASAQALDVFAYTTVGLAIALIATLVYFIVLKKPKPS